MEGFSEADISAKLITPALIKAGWDETTQIRRDVVLPAESIDTQGKLSSRNDKNIRVDYVLQSEEGTPVAVIEAKRGSLKIGSGMRQAEQYAKTLDVPSFFVFDEYGFFSNYRLSLSSGNVENEYFLDEFPSPKELWQRYETYRSIVDDQESLNIHHPYNNDFSDLPRHYQVEAFRRVVEKILSGEKRLLLVMALGTGRTHTTLQIIRRLWESQRVRRVLFLVDRKILAHQVLVSAEKSLMTTVTQIRNRKIDPTYDFHVGLYQSFTGTDESQKTFKSVPRNFFDLIVIDECHRGSSSESSAWREVLEYFDGSIQLGLTATPQEAIDVSNTTYFGDPVYTYSQKQGIQDGFLAPYKVLRIDVDNILGDRVSLSSLEDGHEMDRILVHDKRTELVAEQVMKQLNATDPYSKTVIFCENIEHAERMRKAIANVAKQLVLENSKYVVRITGDDKDANYNLSRFINPESRYPVIATTCELLASGVGTSTCKLIVLDKEVKSLNAYQQIIGLGSRISESHDNYFLTIMDFRGVTERFEHDAFDDKPVLVDDDSVLPEFEEEEESGGQDISSIVSPYPSSFPPLWAESWGDDECGLYADLNYHNVIQRFRWIAAGDFMMGSPEDEPERDEKEDQHKVELTDGYWLADTAVTQTLWLSVMGENPANFNKIEMSPVESVSWNQCKEFTKKLNKVFSEQLSDMIFRLPTEAEWEHACRAGTTTPFSFGESISGELGNFNGSFPYNAGEQSETIGGTVATKSLPKNQWGLYEMHGNVWEWCADAWGKRLKGKAVVNPLPHHNNDDRASRVRRGGSWANLGRYSRSAFRGRLSPDRSNSRTGFRLALGYELRK